MKWLLLIVLALCACTPSGAGTTPDTVTVDVGVPDYVRSHWGRWNDPDKNCQDTRQEVLVAEGEDLVFSDDGCKVLSGTWNCPYTGEVFTNPRKLDIDHMVPLKAAHTAGGWEWERERKKAYFNDQSYEHHLVAVSLSANRSKGSKTPMEWMPKNKAHHCDYLRAWATVKKNWRLEMECPFLLSMLVEACGDGQ
jgi:hypothetical protein